MPNYGVIDLGSNSVRLCVYEVKDDSKKHYSKKDFHTLLNNKAMAGLSAHVEKGAFTKLGIEHAVDVLKGHNKRLKYFACKNTEVFATAVLRNCSNSQEVIKTIEEKTGFSIKLLSEDNEAHLGFVGASCGKEIEEGSLIDIGGGSTELSRIRDNIDSDNASIAQGSLSSYANYVAGVLPKQQEAKMIVDELRKRLHSLPTHERYTHKNFYGIGGSLRAAAKVYAEIFAQGEQPEVFTCDHFDKLFEYCQKNPDSFAHLALKAAPDRIHTVVPGFLIAATIMEEFGANSLILCKDGLREGYLIERMLHAKALK